MSQLTTEQLVIGSTMQIERRDNDANVSQIYPVSLLGYATQRSLIVAPHDRIQARVDFQPGDQFILRIAHDGAHQAFETSVLSVAFQPYYHLHLQFPQQLNETAQRRSSRYPVDLPVLRLTIREGVKDYEVTMADISVQGACLVCDQVLGQQGEFFSIDIPLPGSTDMISLPCNIRYVREEPGSQKKQYFHGVEFSGLDDEAQIFLSGYIEELAHHMHIQD